jgi:hypothetical protein
MTEPTPFPTPHARERERWLAVAFCAIAGILDRPQAQQQLSLRTLLDAKFSGVPDQPPALDDTQAYAAFAVKALLECLTDNSRILQQTAEIARAIFTEMMAADNDSSESRAARETLARDGAIRLSLALRHGVPLDMIKHSLRREQARNTIIDAVVERLVKDWRRRRR